jgi:uncharacterized protein YijF (DUF1287 family)
MSQYLKNIILLVLVIGYSNISADAQTNFGIILADSAFLLTKTQVRYDPAYYSIGYPMGDVPSDRGVCTDVVIRAYRKLNIDLQKLVHEDMRLNFNQYPKIWELKSTDKNIDHRRVPNLAVFFSKYGKSLTVTTLASDYLPGDLVTYLLPGNLPHIAVVSNLKSNTTNRYLIIHNIGSGQVAEDHLFHYKITGHYRYKPN